MSTPMTEVLETVRQAHSLADMALTQVQQRRDESRLDVTELTEVVGTLAAILRRWEREKAKWAA